MNTYNRTTTLTADINATTTTIPLTSVAQVPAGPRTIRIGDELIRYNSANIAGNSLTNVTRGYGATTAASHSTSDTVELGVFGSFTRLGLPGGVDVAEVLVFDGTLTDEDREAVEAYLTDKYWEDGLTTTGTTTAVATGTDDSVDLAVGEQVTYELQVTLEEGTWSNVVVEDLLPVAREGSLEFVSASITAANNPVGITSNGTLLENLDLTAGNGVLTVSGDNDEVLTFSLGTVLNNAANPVSGDTDVLTIQVTAVVTDVAANVDGATALNTATVTALSSLAPSISQTAADSDTATVDIVEPELELKKFVTNGAGFLSDNQNGTGNFVVPEGDAGDTFTNTLVIDHNGSDAAYDRINDAFTSFTTTSSSIGFGVATGGGVDGFNANMVIAHTQSFTNNTGSPMVVEPTAFNFTVGNNRGQVTPFIVQVDDSAADNADDFTIVAIGETRTSGTDYTATGDVRFDFGGASFLLQPGQTIAPAFLDATVDGNSAGSVIPYVDSNNGIYYTGGGADSNSGDLTGGIGGSPTGEWRDHYAGTRLPFRHRF